MNETRKMMMSIIMGTYTEYSDAELAEMYQKVEDPEILATEFVRLYGMIIRTTEQYFGIDEQDFVTMSLERLHYCLSNYVSSKMCSFSSYYISCLKGTFWTKVEENSAAKRKLNSVACSIEGLMENGAGTDNYRDVIAGSYDIEYVYEDVSEFMDTSRLSDRESEYCNYLYKGYSNCEIAQLMGISVMGLSYMRQRLQKKLNKSDLVLA